MKCPSCKSLNVRGSGRIQLADLAKRVQGLSAYRCRNCRHRFYGPRDPTENLSAKMAHFWTSESYRSLVMDRCRVIGRQAALFGFGLALFFGMLRLVSN